MARLLAGHRAIVAAAATVLVASVVSACAEQVTSIRPRTPDALLVPTPRGPGGAPQPVDTSTSSLGPAHPSAVTIGGLPTNGQVTVGVAVPLTVSATDSAGRPLSGLVTAWTVADTSLATIDSATGVLTAKKPSVVDVAVFVNDTTAWASLVAVPVNASGNPSPNPSPPPSPTPSPGPPPSPGTVALSIVRFDGAATGPLTVSNGIPLMPGALRPGQEGLVRIVVGGVEQPAYVAGLSSLHADGSLRAVLVQFQLPTFDVATAIAGGVQLQIGTAPAAANVLAAPIVRPGAATPGTPDGLPQGAALPSDPNYLVATDLVGPTTLSGATSALGGAFARYETDFVTYSTRLWNSEGARWDANYYDRALIYYAMWARTGNPTFWARAGQLAYGYRTQYLEKNNYGSSPHWAQLEGLEKHYLLTGDEASRVAVVKTANALYVLYINTGYVTPSSGESRIAARVLHGQLLAWRVTPAGSAPIAGIASATNWGARIEAMLGKVVAWQQPDGSYPAIGQVCGGQLNYMIGLLNDALIKTYDYYVPTVTPRATLQGQIATLVTRAVDYLWNTQWLASGRAFQYASVPCPGIGNTTPAPDLNNMIVAGFGWVYRRTGDAKYLAAGEQIFAGGVTQAFLSGTKQFNEQYTSSFRYFGYR